jgi:hypothetical protein
VELGWSELLCREELWFMMRDGEMRRGKISPPVSGLHMLFGEAPTKLQEHCQTRWDESPASGHV